MSVCRRELGGGGCNPLGNSNPALRLHVPSFTGSDFSQCGKIDHTFVARTLTSERVWSTTMALTEAFQGKTKL